MEVRLGVDVGSTTLKLVAERHGRGIWTWVARHRGDPIAAASRALAKLPPELCAVRPYVTGSGARLLAARWRAPVVHEVSAVAATARRRHPGARAIFELGGQDAKLVLFEPDPDGGLPRVAMTMNDRCAAGTGVTIDRCLLRLGCSPERAAQVAYHPERVRPVSAKCGVFAETDLVNLARAGVPVDELVASLAEAIVVQNLAVLARGATPWPEVLLLGGPHAYLPVLAAAWRHALARIWREREVPVPEDSGVRVPEDALLFAAIGACEVGAARHPELPATSPLRLAALLSGPGPDETATRLDTPLALAPAAAGPRTRGAARRAGDYLVGIDAGSTVCKVVVATPAGELIAARGRRSLDPIGDVRALLVELEGELGKPLAPRALGVTGYAAGVLAPVLGADLEIVETVAHARAARHVAPDADVVCDVGGQDIKVLALAPDGGIRDFWLSSQCSAGIGMVLEATARELGVPLDAYAERAFAARRAPWFGDACVVFLDANRVTFQRQGFSPDEILAGLARALPRVVWTQVLCGTHPASLGRTFVLQGGVQLNRAAVQAQIDWLTRAVPGARVRVHPWAAEAGALGAALVAGDAVRARVPSRVAAPARVIVRSAEETRCGLCANRCPRTFVTVEGGAEPLVIGNACAEGATASAPASSRRKVTARKRRLTPNLLAEEVRLLFQRQRQRQQEQQEQQQRPRARGRHAPDRSPRLRVGIPRTLAMYRAAPFFRAYLEHAGAEVVFSPVTSDGLWRDGAARGVSDPCFPVKVTLGHVHHLLQREPIDALFIPHVTTAQTPVRHVAGSASCPVVAASPSLIKASFGEELARRAVAVIDPLITFTDPALLRDQMRAAFAPILGISPEASDAAVVAGQDAMRHMDAALGAAARRILDEVERTPGRGAVLVLARPYHADPGLNHRLGEELQALGYPVFGCRAAPRDPTYLARVLAPDLDSGRIADPFDVRDLSPECGNSGAAEKLWAARFAARHGRLGVVDLSSFKCGQDTPVYAAVRDLLGAAGVVTCNLHDLDETRPVTSLRVRLRTFAHALAARGLGPVPEAT